MTDPKKKATSKTSTENKPVTKKTSEKTTGPVKKVASASTTKSMVKPKK